MPKLAEKVNLAGGSPPPDEGVVVVGVVVVGVVVFGVVVVGVVVVGVVVVGVVVPLFVASTVVLGLALP